MGNQNKAIGCNKCLETQKQKNIETSGQQFSTNLITSPPIQNQIGNTFKQQHRNQKLGVTISNKKQLSTTQYTSRASIQLEIGRQQFFIQANQTTANSTLRDMIEFKSTKKQLFTHHQIMDIISVLMDSFQFLYYNQIPYHDYDFSTIYYKSTPKLLHPNCYCISGYQLARNKKRFSYLSAEQIQKLMENIPQHLICKQVMQRGDIFAIGCIILQCCTLISSCKIYNQQDYTINTKYIDQLLFQSLCRYHPSISQFLKILLQTNPHKQIVETAIQFYKQRIVKLKDLNSKSMYSPTKNMNMPHFQSSIIKRSNLKPIVTIIEQTQYSSTSQHISKATSPHSLYFPTKN